MIMEDLWKIMEDLWIVIILSANVSSHPFSIFGFIEIMIDCEKRSKQLLNRKVFVPIWLIYSKTSSGCILNEVFSVHTFALCIFLVCCKWYHSQTLKTTLWKVVYFERQAAYLAKTLWQLKTRYLCKICWNCLSFFTCLRRLPKTAVILSKTLTGICMQLSVPVVFNFYQALAEVIKNYLPQLR